MIDIWCPWHESDAATVTFYLLNEKCYTIKIIKFNTFFRVVNKIIWFILVNYTLRN